MVEFGPVRAVGGVTFRLPAGPYGLALVGESGSGKTTIARAVTRLVSATSGAIRLDGVDVVGSGWIEPRAPRLPARRADRVPGPDDVARPACADRFDDRGALAGAQDRSSRRRRRAHRRAAHRGRPRPRDGPPLPAPALGRPAPARGDRARSPVEPRVLILDEPTSALDVTVQARIPRAHRQASPRTRARVRADRRTTWRWSSSS